MPESVEDHVEVVVSHGDDHDHLLIMSTADDHDHDQIEKGGTKTLPFLTGSMFFLSLAVNGVTVNLLVYLVREFRMERVLAAEIVNIINGCLNLFPILGAVLADSYLGCLRVIFISSIISILGLIPLTLITIFPSLHPSPCSPSISYCQPPSSFQYALLYASLLLIVLGVGGTQFTMTTLGSNQFQGDAKNVEMFLNWFLLALNGSYVVTGLAIPYIEENLSWSVSYGMCLAANLVGFVLLISGRKHYKEVRPEGSPFGNIARVIIAAIRKSKVPILMLGMMEKEKYYYGHDRILMDNAKSINTNPNPSAPLTPRLRFLNRAALIMPGDMNERDGSIAKAWRLCTVQQVEDLKTILRVFPVWSSCILISVLIGVVVNLNILQALVMDRRITPHFTIPAATIGVCTPLTVVLVVVLIDRFLYPLLWKLKHVSPTFLNRLGAGHILNVVALVTFGLVESKRLQVWRRTQPSDGIVPMSAMWLVVPYLVLGVGEACHWAGEIGFLYQEFPMDLKSMATASGAMLLAIGFYVSAALIGLLRKTTSWLPDNLNEGHVDYVYYVLAMVGLCNFFYFFLCAKLYKRN